MSVSRAGAGAGGRDLRRVPGLGLERLPTRAVPGAAVSGPLADVRGSEGAARSLTLGRAEGAARSRSCAPRSRRARSSDDRRARARSRPRPRRSRRRWRPSPRASRPRSRDRRRRGRRWRGHGAASEAGEQRRADPLLLSRRRLPGAPREIEERPRFATHVAHRILQPSWARRRTTARSNACRAARSREATVLTFSPTAAAISRRLCCSSSARTKTIRLSSSISSRISASTWGAPERSLPRSFGAAVSAARLSGSTSPRPRRASRRWSWSDPPDDAKQPRLDRGAALELAEASVDDDERLLNGVLDVRLGDAEATEGAEHEREVLRIDRLERGPHERALGGARRMHHDQREGIEAERWPHGALCCEPGCFVIKSEPRRRRRGDRPPPRAGAPSRGSRNRRATG